MPSLAAIAQRLTGAAILGALVLTIYWGLQTTQAPASAAKERWAQLSGKEQDNISAALLSSGKARFRGAWWWDAVLTATGSLTALTEQHDVCVDSEGTVFVAGGADNNAVVAWWRIDAGWAMVRDEHLSSFLGCGASRYGRGAVFVARGTGDTIAVRAFDDGELKTVDNSLAGDPADIAITRSGSIVVSGTSKNKPYIHWIGGTNPLWIETQNASHARLHTAGETVVAEMRIGAAPVFVWSNIQGLFRVIGPDSGPGASALDENGKIWTSYREERTQKFHLRVLGEQGVDAPIPGATAIDSLVAVPNTGHLVAFGRFGDLYRGATINQSTGETTPLITALSETSVWDASFIGGEIVGLVTRSSPVSIVPVRESGHRHPGILTRGLPELIERQTVEIRAEIVPFLLYLLLSASFVLFVQGLSLLFGTTRMWQILGGAFLQAMSIAFLRAPNSLTGVASAAALPGGPTTGGGATTTGGTQTGGGTMTGGGSAPSGSSLTTSGSVTGTAQLTANPTLTRFTDRVLPSAVEVFRWHLDGLRILSAQVAARANRALIAGIFTAALPIFWLFVDSPLRDLTGDWQKNIPQMLHSLVVAAIPEAIAFFFLRLHRRRSEELARLVLLTANDSRALVGYQMGTISASAPPEAMRAFLSPVTGGAETEPKDQGVIHEVLLEAIKKMPSK